MSRVFHDIVTRCDGMLSAAAYQKIYETGLRGGLIVEVGTALGAGTTALALGLRDSGKPGHVFSFDPMTGGPRRDIATPEARRERVQDNLRFFGVEDYVNLVVATLPECIHIVPQQNLSVLMLDADGMIDRDIAVAAPLLRESTALIIDDCCDLVRLKKRGWSLYRVDQKMKLTFLLIDILRSGRFMSRGTMVKDTYFGEVVDVAQLPRLRPQIMEAYRSLVFADAPLTHRARAREFMVRNLDRFFPTTLQRLRAAYRQKPIDNQSRKTWPGPEERSREAPSLVK